MTEELPRWAAAESEAPEGLRELLRTGQSERAGAGELAVLKQSLARALGPAAGLGDAPHNPSGPSADMPEAAAPPSAAAPSAAPEPLPGVEAARVSAGGVRRLWPWLGGGVVLGTALLALLRPPSVPSVVVVPPASESSEREPVAVPPGVAPEVPPAGAALEPVASVEAAPSAAAPAALSAEPASPAPVGNEVTSLRSAAAPKPALGEAELLRRAQALLSAQPARALALAEEHRRRFARGVLREEREVIAIEALKRLGRERAAAKRAAAFESRYRGSVHESRVRGATESTPPLR